MASKGNKRDAAKEKFWRVAFVRHQDSGLSIKEFCARENLNTNTFQYWKKEIANRDEACALKRQPKQVLLPVKVLDAEPLPAEFIEIRTADGVTIRVPLSCRADVVGGLVAGLRGK